MKKSLLSAGSVLALLILLLFPDLALDGARNGLRLWAWVVVPTLFPFMVCSSILVALDAVHILIFPVKGLCRRLFKLSDNGTYILVTGLLCSCPMGAASLSQFLEDRRISKAEGQYLLSICNHPSPMFLAGFAGACLPPQVPVWLFLCSVYGSILPLSVLSRRFYTPKAKASPLQPSKAAASLDRILLRSTETILKIGGYITLFSIAVAFLMAMPAGSPQTKAMILAFVEITTGIQAVSQEIPGTACGFFLSMASAFGGLCAVFQTKSVIKNAGLSIRHYVIWKAIHSLLSGGVFILLAYCLAPHLAPG